MSDLGKAKSDLGKTKSDLDKAKQRFREMTVRALNRGKVLLEGTSFSDVAKAINIDKIEADLVGKEEDFKCVIGSIGEKLAVNNIYNYKTNEFITDTRSITGFVMSFVGVIASMSNDPLDLSFLEDGERIEQDIINILEHEERTQLMKQVFKYVVFLSR